MPVATQNNVIPFPVRSPVSKKPDSNAQLLLAAKVAERAITLALGDEAADRNVVVCKLRSAISGAENTPKPPSTPSPAVKLTEAAGAQLLRDTRSQTCFCGSGKASGKPFCLRCYHSLPERMRASMYLSPLDSNHIFDAILEARQYLARIGVLSASEAIA